MICQYLHTQNDAKSQLCTGPHNQKTWALLDRDVHKVLGIKEIILNNDIEQSVWIRLLIRKIGKKLINGSQNGPRTMLDA